MTTTTIATTTAVIITITTVTNDHVASTFIGEAFGFVAPSAARWRHVSPSPVRSQIAGLKMIQSSRWSSDGHGEGAWPEVGTGLLPSVSRWPHSTRNLINLNRTLLIFRCVWSVAGCWGILEGFLRDSWWCHQWCSNAAALWTPTSNQLTNGREGKATDKKHKEEEEEEEEDDNKGRRG